MCCTREDAELHEQQVRDAVKVLASPEGIIGDRSLLLALTINDRTARLALDVINTQTVYPACSHVTNNAICDYPVIKGRKTCSHTCYEVVFYDECDRKGCHNRAITNSADHRLCLSCFPRFIVEVDTFTPGSLRLALETLESAEVRSMLYSTADTPTW